jgi:hypothetical protein
MEEYMRNLFRTEVVIVDVHGRVVQHYPSRGRATVQEGQLKLGQMPLRYIDVGVPVFRREALTKEVIKGLPDPNDREPILVPNHVAEAMRALGVVHGAGVYTKGRPLYKPAPAGKKKPLELLGFMELIFHEDLSGKN